MSKLRLTISVSLDGYVAGPNQSLENPLGEGGRRLHEWAFALAYFRKKLGMEGGETNTSTQVAEEQFDNQGATIMGRNMFGGGRGPWNEREPWNGWWGSNPPYHHPVFVLTHHRREPLAMEGGTTFHFVTDGIESALAQARKAAGDKDINLAGGAEAANQYLKAGVVDQMDLNVAPILLGSGERLFQDVGPDLHGLKLVRTIGTDKVVHLRFARG